MASAVVVRVAVVVVVVMVSVGMAAGVMSVVVGVVMVCVVTVVSVMSVVGVVAMVSVGMVVGVMSVVAGLAVVGVVVMSVVVAFVMVSVVVVVGVMSVVGAVVMVSVGMAGVRIVRQGSGAAVLAVCAATDAMRPRRQALAAGAGWPGEVPLESTKSWSTRIASLSLTTSHRPKKRTQKPMPSTRPARQSGLPVRPTGNAFEAKPRQRLLVPRAQSQAVRSQQAKQSGNGAPLRPLSASLSLLAGCRIRSVN